MAGTLQEGMMARPDLDSVPVIDLFAGPGGLAEGFASHDADSVRFSVALSIEKDPLARKTLELRKFFRHFPPGEVPEDYYRYVRGEITREDLEESYPSEFDNARLQARLIELGGTAHPDDEIRRIIADALAGDPRKWVLVGGPPCQAYSVAGRSRIRPGNEDAYLSDRRHQLYREYLKIIAWFSPPVFVMENVPGLISTILKDERICNRILEDLEDPRRAISTDVAAKPGETHRYVVFSLAHPRERNLFGHDHLDPRNYIVEAERFGIPQRRHRVFFLGVREDLVARLDEISQMLEPSLHEISVADVIDGLPILRSRLSRESDTPENWRSAIIEQMADLETDEFDPAILSVMRESCRELEDRSSSGGQFVKGGTPPRVLSDWFVDPRIGGALNHESRSHMRSDLIRYLFLSSAASIGKDLKLSGFPRSLLPAHVNVQKSLDSGNGYFSDRFRVQMADRPATTITAHINKDGHYFIHPDPTQCRSFTVREAARIQTFPDNYFFEGPRTEQFRQVGNAVPPLLARQIAGIVARILG